MKKDTRKLCHKIINFFIPYNEIDDIDDSIEEDVLEEVKLHTAPESRRFVYGENDIFYDKLVHDKMKRMMSESQRELFTYEQVILLLEECQLQERARFIAIFLKQFEENDSDSQYPETDEDLNHLAKEILDLNEEYFSILQKRFRLCVESKR